MSTTEQKQISFFSELQRRNVVRVAVFYVLAAWLVIQVADVLFGMLGVPDWSGRLVLGLLALGFPIALVFAWVFELTPEGVKKQREVDLQRSIVHETGRKLNVAIGILAVIAIAGMIVDRWIPRSNVPAVAEQPIPAPAAGESDVATVSEQPSIAVLPFADMSQAGDQEYFADGLSEELLNLLAQIDELKVIGRTSSFQFKGRNEDLRVIGEQLGVANILEGSVRKSGDKLRVTAQLIRASDGSHLWSDTYDRQLDDVFALQDEIASAVVDVLRLKLLGETRSVRAARHDPAAYNLYLEGRFEGERRTEQSLDRAVTLYREAIERDPGFALAWVGLSIAYQDQAGQTGQLPFDEGYGLARDAVERALAIDPTLPRAHAALARIQGNYDWDWAAADASATRALELAPTDADILGTVGVRDLAMGRFHEGVERFGEAIERDPLRAPLHYNQALALIAAGRYDEAETAARRAVTLAAADSSGYYWNVALAVLLQGRFDEAAALVARESDEFWRLFGEALIAHAQRRQQEADKLLERMIAEEAEVAAYQIAELYAWRDQPDEAFEWLERAYQQRDPGVSEILGSPFLQRLAQDPRYGAFLDKVGLPKLAA
ncbi:MAG TPA: tetratricopeptide repeat protein [Steroidobacteraceae bacterium]|nr:tetratricopeptide repeat protein [Steroidobacteraceae bacterium]